MIKQQIQTDILASLKSGNRVMSTTLRFILSQIKNKEIEKGGELTNDDEVAVLKKINKELNESILAFTKANRTELATEYQAQLDVVVKYLPAEISDDQLKQEIKNLIANNQAVIQANPKAIIGVAIKELKSKADPQRIMKFLNEALSS